MGVTQKGIGVAWGITDSGYTYTGSATALAVKATEQNLSKDAEVDESKDPSTGSTIGVTFFNPTQEVTLRVYPYGASLSAATTAAAALPSIGDKFVVTNSGDAAVAGNYITMKVSRMRKVGGKAEFDITIKQWDSDLSATIS